jgi:6-phosphogluconolactonase (cycloisomerase 2 family)
MPCIRVSLDPTGHLLYVANQGSNTVYVFRIQQTDGDLTNLGKVADLTSPSFVKVFFLSSP